MIGAIVGLMPSILQIAKDFSFEKWKDKRALDSNFQRHKNWVILAAAELCAVLKHIIAKDPPEFFDENLIYTQPARPVKTSSDDPYYRKYYLVVSVYRLSALLGWLELYRQDITFLNSGQADKRNLLEKSVEEIRNVLENEKLNQAPDAGEWADAIILREEQRAIGETMIVSDGNTKSVMGYGKYCDLFNPLTGEGQDYWIEKATNFFLTQQNVAKDFRPERIKLLIIHLVNLIELLGTTRTQAKLLEWRAEFEQSLQVRLEAKDEARSAVMP